MRLSGERLRCKRQLTQLNPVNRSITRNDTETFGAVSAARNRLPTRAEHAAFKSDLFTASVRSQR